MHARDRARPRLKTPLCAARLKLPPRVAQWVEIEGLRTAGDHTQLRLRTLASAAGVKLA